MKLYYFCVAEDVPTGINPESSVVIDVLRATTTIAWALENGADSVQVFADVDELKREAKAFHEKDKILVGERGGKKLDGFDLGNSPMGVSTETVKGKRVFMSTTNGTRSLHRVRESKSLYTMALPNRRAIAERLQRDNPNEVWIVGSGWEGSYSLEDSLAAGALASLLIDQLDSVQVLNDELMASIALWKTWENDVEGCLRIASHGQRLAGIGNHDDDFACCASLDNLSVIPQQIEMGVLRSS